MVSDDEDYQPTIRDKYNPIDRTWTGHTISVQPFDISDDEYKAETPEEPRGMVLCIPISPSQDQEDESEDAQPRHVSFNIDLALEPDEQQSTTYNTVTGFLILQYKYGHLSFKRLRCMVKLRIMAK